MPSDVVKECTNLIDAQQGHEAGRIITKSVGDGVLRSTEMYDFATQDRFQQCMKIRTQDVLENSG